jgi:hypothetical protein
MQAPLPFKYKAFLSYSHADTKTAAWLHKRLEGFPLRGLAGRETDLGPVPKQLPHWRSGQCARLPPPRQRHHGADDQDFAG